MKINFLNCTHCQTRFLGDTCPQCTPSILSTLDKRKPFNQLVPNEDFYLENGFIVFTEKYHTDRGYCCESGCRHCPFRS